MKLTKVSIATLPIAREKAGANAKRTAATATGAAMQADTFERAVPRSAARGPNLAAALTAKLPDLAGSDTDAQAENVETEGTRHATTDLEEMRLFRVADRLAAQFPTGLLPLGRGDEEGAADSTSGSEPLREAERRELLARALAPAGDGDDGDD
jgi:hypothetical protein